MVRIVATRPLMGASKTGTRPSGVTRRTSMRVERPRMRLRSVGAVKAPTHECVTAVGFCDVAT
jgi:hypothetical protein